MRRKTLKGQNILLVEDEYYQAIETKHLLEDAGAKVVGPTAHAGDVAALLAENAVDAALIDINLGYGADFTVARSLRDADVPFMFVTGYDAASIPDDLATVPRLEKPVAEEHVLERLAALSSQTE